MSHPSLCTAQGGIILILDVVSEKHSILARSVFVLHGHRLCRDIAVVLIASTAIGISDIFETRNWRFTGSEIRGLPYQEGRHWRDLWVVRCGCGRGWGVAGRRGGGEGRQGCVTLRREFVLAPHCHFRRSAGDGGHAFFIWEGGMRTEPFLLHV